MNDKAKWEQAVLERAQKLIYPSFDLVAVAVEIGKLEHDPDTTPEEWVDNYIKKHGLEKFVEGVFNEKNI